MRPADPTVYNIPVVGRDEFIVDIFEPAYSDGQHVTFLGPTQRGKTTLCMELLSQVATRDRKAVILAGKPPGRDRTMDMVPAKLNMRQIPEWPPPTEARFWRDRDRTGWVLRPRQTLTDLQGDKLNIQRQFRAGIVGNYSETKHPRIVVVDEAHHVQHELGLKEECEAVLMRGAPDCAMWSLAQRGRFLTYPTYNAPEWVFVYHDPDRTNRQRYADIGGTDPDVVMELTAGLQTHTAPQGNTISECLCFRRSGSQLYIVDVQ